MLRPRTRELGWEAALHILGGLLCALIFVNSTTLWVTTLAGIIGFCLLAIGLTLGAILVFEL